MAKPLRGHEAPQTFVLLGAIKVNARRRLNCVFFLEVAPSALTKTAQAEFLGSAEGLMHNVRVQEVDFDFVKPLGLVVGSVEFCMARVGWDSLEYPWKSWIMHCKTSLQPLMKLKILPPPKAAVKINLVKFGFNFS